MSINGIWSYIVLELLFVVSSACVYLYMRNRRLLAASRQTAPDITEPALSIDDYATLLQQQILKTEAKLALLDNTGDTESRLRALASMRLEILQAERKAIDCSGQDDDKLWAQLDESLSPFIPADASEATPIDAQSAMLTALQARILAYQQRIANLEKFKENFFALKQRHADAAVVNQRLHDEVEKAIPADEQSPELREAMQSLKDENVRLEQELSIVEQEFDGLMRKLNNTIQDHPTEKPDIAVVHSMDSIGQKVGVIKDFVNGQDEQIKLLSSIISDLQIEVNEKQRLQDGMDKLESQNNELNDAIEIIQEENTFLQEQISALLTQELESDKSNNMQVDKLQAELTQQAGAYAELENKYATMETEYLAAYEENQKLKGQ